MLAVLANAMSLSASLDLFALQEELERLETRFDHTPPEEWLIPGADLCTEIAAEVGDWPPLPPASAARFGEYMAALQRLDRWHRPLLPTEIDLTRLDEHEALLDNMELHLRFNSNGDYGSVIPRLATGSPFPRLDKAALDLNTAPTAFAIVSALLDICVFLPATVMGCEPDAPSTTVGTRLITFNYRRFPPDTIGFPWPPDAFRVAIAPVAESAVDASLWVKGDRYSITPAVPLTRFAAILRGAFANRAHVLLLPEMTVDGALLPDFIDILRSLRLEFNAADRDQTPSLRLLLIGVIAAPTSPDGLHRNYVAALDGGGQVLFTQDKLSHWNLDSRAQARFGLDGRGYPIPLLENTAPGTNIEVVEFDGLGRLMALVCADMSHDMPGDWITDHIGLDWLYAPIMDGSTCDQQGRFPWIVQRALRLCERAGTTVMVTNSMVMSHWNNDVIAKMPVHPSNPYRLYSACGIGFLARKNGPETIIHHALINIASASPVLHFVDWSTGWTAP
jgi:hypothetical protein